MADVTVVQSDEVELRPGSVPGLGVRPTLGPQTGFSVLQQAVLECEPGRTDPILVTEVEETIPPRQGKKKQPGLLEAFDDDLLLSFAVPVVLLPSVRKTTRAQARPSRRPRVTMYKLLVLSRSMIW